MEVLVKNQTSARMFICSFVWLTAKTRTEADLSGTA